MDTPHEPAYTTIMKPEMLTNHMANWRRGLVVVGVFGIASGCFGQATLNTNSAQSVFNNFMAQRMAEEKSWTQAESAINNLMEQQIARVKLYLTNDSPKCVEIRDPLVKQYLPNLRLFILDTGFASVSRIFFVDKQAHIYDLGHGVWQCEGGSAVSPCHIPDVTRFLRTREIKVSTDKQAVEVAKLVEAIGSAPDRVGFLRINTKNYTIYDEAIMHMAACDRDLVYEYKAERIPSGWKVIVTYVGPPAQIFLPPIYEITLDKNDNFTDIQNVATLGPLPRSGAK